MKRRDKGWGREMGPGRGPGKGTLLVLFLLIASPATGQDQVLGGSGFQELLDGLYEEMMPLCAPLMDYARLLAGFAALWFIGYRVGISLSRAEPLDWFGLFRPFVLGFCILIFPQVLALMNGLLNPLTGLTRDMEFESRQHLESLQQQWDRLREQSGDAAPVWGSEALPLPPLPDPEENPENPGWWAAMKAGIQQQMERASWSLRLAARAAMGEALKGMYFAASLCIDLVRCFYLIILSLFGPLVFAFACFDGMAHSVTAWISRYIHVTLWLPVSQILGTLLSRIQAQMVLRDMEAWKAGQPTLFGSEDMGYMVFLIMGIVSYFFVPTLSGYLVTWGSGGWVHRPWNQVIMTSGQLWTRKSK